MENKPELGRIHIDGRTWWDRKCGNHYSTCEVFMSPDYSLVTKYMDGGHGEGCIANLAHELLVQAGHLQPLERYNSGACESALRKLRELGASISIAEVGRRKDLHKGGK